MKVIFFYFTVFFLLTSCDESKSLEETQDVPVQADSAQILLNELLEAHGKLGDFQFTFRDNLYSIREDVHGFSYSKTVISDSLEIHDFLGEEGFSRMENGNYLSLSIEDEQKYQEALNSVVYFVCLPQRLTDPGVNLEVMKPTIIQNQLYSVLRVTFDEEGGGTDFEDVFYYWINQSNHQMDFLAYQYKVNGGGVRFRKAFNSRMIGGMRFQDYINYEAPVGTPLDSLPIYFEAEQLKEISQILTENILPL